MKELFQTGTEPEFFVRHIAKFDFAEGVCRLYMATERNGIFRLETTLLTSIAGLRDIGRNALRIAADPIASMLLAQGLTIH